MVLDLLASRELAWRLFVRNISAQYRQTFLGYIWAFLPPIVSTAVFVFLNSQQILHIDDTAIPYPAYVMIGILLWQVFVDALNSPIRLVTTSKAMLAKINFPREALILTGLYEVIFNFLIRLLLLFAAFLWFQIPVPKTAIFAPLGIFAIIVFGLMIGLMLTPLAVLYQDIERGLGVFLQLWFFLTPIVYPPPATWPASLIAQLNPASSLLVTTRDWLTLGHAPFLNSFIVISVIVFSLLFAGWVLYRLAMPHLIARMSA
jgi:lipopolysaccharide transport system permease protein